MGKKNLWFSGVSDSEPPDNESQLIMANCAWIPLNALIALKAVSLGMEAKHQTNQTVFFHKSPLMKDSFFTDPVEAPCVQTSLHVRKMFCS